MMTGDSPYNNYNPDRGRHSFEIASLVMSIISMVLLCTGILAIPFGALGILFAVLSTDRGDHIRCINGYRSSHNRLCDLYVNDRSFGS